MFATSLYSIIKACCILLFLTHVVKIEAAVFATTAPYNGQTYTSIGHPRSLLLDPSGKILVLSTTMSCIVALVDKDNSSPHGPDKVVIVNGTSLNLNHGLAYSNNYLYASSAQAVYRWPYVPGQLSLVTSEPQMVVNNIVSNGHFTRTMVFDREDKLYVTTGSNENVDADSTRARIRRFDVSNEDGYPFDFEEAELFADGCRNEVGLAFDSQGILWGVENGANLLSRPDLGNDSYINWFNPGEELNKFDGPPGTHYGYPYCFSSFAIEDYEPGSQFAWPTFMDDGLHTDAWCQDPLNNRPPALSLPAHHAPLGITFFDDPFNCCDATQGSFPCSRVGDAVVAFHGSGDPNNPMPGHVAWIPFNKTSGNPMGQILDIIFNPNVNNSGQCGGPCLKPVDVCFDTNCHLILSSDYSNEIIRVTHDPMVW